MSITYKKITGLPAASSVLSTDLVEITHDPAGSPVSQKATIAQLSGTGRLFDHFTDASTSGTGATDLYSDAIAANTLTASGSWLSARYMTSVGFGGVGFTPTLAVFFAGTSIFTTATNAFSSITSPIIFETLVDIVRTGTTTARATVMNLASYASASPSLVINSLITDLTGLDFTAGNILKLVGTTSNASFPVTAKMGIVLLQF